MKKTDCLLFQLLLLLIAITGFKNETFAQKQFIKKVELGKAGKVRTEISFIAGNLDIHAGTGSLSEGVFSYKKDIWEPVITYSEDSHTGDLKISNRDTREERNFNNSDKSKWDLKLNKEIPTELKIKMGAGEGNIDLRGSNLSRFEFKMGAGEVNINLRNTSVPELRFSAGAGEAVIDLSGEWNNSLNGEIKGGVGEVTIKLPRNTSVELTISGMLGEVNTPGFQKHGKSYTNSMFGRTKETIHLDISGGIGSVNIELID